MHKPFHFFRMDEIYSTGIRLHLNLTKYIFTVKQLRINLIWCQIMLANNKDFG